MLTSIPEFFSAFGPSSKFLQFIFFHLSSPPCKIVLLTHAILRSESSPSLICTVEIFCPKQGSFLSRSDQSRVMLFSFFAVCCVLEELTSSSLFETSFPTSFDVAFAIAPKLTPSADDVSDLKSGS